MHRVPRVVVTVKDLIEELSTLDPNSLVVAKPKKSKSRCLIVDPGVGFSGPGNYILDSSCPGFVAAESQNKTFPVVWV